MLRHACREGGFRGAYFSIDTSAAWHEQVMAWLFPTGVTTHVPLVHAGRHREAVFWIVATFARCHTILAADAPPELHRALAPGFDAILAELGITSTTDLLRRSEAVTEFLPRLWETTGAILSANPGITIRS
ncbi:MAG: hypothetical protein ACRDRS_06290 [Pseudonocardiaceae bacterium]